MTRKLIYTLVFFVMALVSQAEDSDFSEFDEFEETSLDNSWSFNGHFEVEQAIGFSGKGAHKDANPNDKFVQANRTIRIQALRVMDKGGVFGKFDFFYDEVTYESDIDVRELRFQYKLASWLDLSIGRQVSTWGVGDMLFINDLFPKNWMANFLGRDMELLKDPSNSVRFTSYFKSWIFDFVYTPEFTPDTTPGGCRFGVFDPNSSKVISNKLACGDYHAKDSTGSNIEDDELALSIKRKISSHELALYFYDGYFKSPRGILTGEKLNGFHPKLRVYGLSDEGQAGLGIVSFEIGYYDSLEDSLGSSYFIENSSLKYLFGFKIDLNANLSLGVQWYQEKMLHYNEYERSFRAANFAEFSFRKKEYQNTATIRLSFKAMQDTLIISIFSYFRPQDKDSFTKLEVSKKFTDNFKILAGINVFSGTDHYRDREFGMLKDDDNAFIRINLSF